MDDALFDVHVHAAPCVTDRRGDDVDTVGWYEAAGFAGCVLKGHCESTVGRAVAAGRDRRVRVHGGVVLNQPAGGVNPAAVAAALSMGGRVVWLPTVDARHHRDAGLAHPPPCTDLDHAPAALPPVDWSTAAPVRAVLELIRDHDAVLATGHVGPDEAAWVVDEARRLGVRRVLLTHPAFTVPGLSATATRELCERGAVAEVTAYQLLHQPGWDGARLAGFVREVGPRHCLLSSDAGQPTSPKPPEALRRLMEALVAAGVDPGAVHAMASDVPARLVTA